MKTMNSYLKCPLLSVVALMLALGGCNSTTQVRKETIVEETPEGEVTSTRTLVNGEEIASLRSDWESEYITAQGRAPVSDKYENSSRNRALARRGAVVDAKRNLAQKISDTQLTSTTTMRDLETSDFVQTQLNAVLRGVEVTTETFNETAGIYTVTVRMPKMKVLSVVEQYVANNQ